MAVDEGNLLVMGVERYILTSSSYGVENEIDLCEREKQGIRVRGKVFGLQYKGLRRIGGGDQADTFNLIQKSQNINVYLKVHEEQWMIARGSNRQAGGYDILTADLSTIR